MIKDVICGCDLHVEYVYMHAYYNTLYIIIGHAMIIIINITSKINYYRKCDP